MCKGGVVLNCPKCNAEIRRFDLSPNCKKCGVHIMYYTQEEDLIRDAKKTELEFASARLLVAKLKAAFLTGKITVMRVVFTVFAIASLLLPLYEINMSFPWWEYKLSVGALGIYNLISDSFLSVFSAFAGVGAGKTLVVLMAVSFVLLIFSALMIVGCAAAGILSFINIRKASKLAAGFSAAAILFQLAGTVISFIAVNLSGAFEFISVKPLYGGLLCIAMLGVVFATNVMLVINEPEIVLRQSDRIRLEVKEKLRKGELTLDELSLPIASDEEKEADKKDKKTKKGRKKK